MNTAAQGGAILGSEKILGTRLGTRSCGPVVGLVSKPHRVSVSLRLTLY